MNETERISGNSGPYWKVIDEEMKARGLTWEQLASDCNMSRSTISTARNEDRTLDLEKTFRIVEVLDLDPDELYVKRSELLILNNSPALELEAIPFPAISSVSERFWILMDYVSKSNPFKKIKWKEISLKTNILQATISAARHQGRTLPYDKDCMIAQTMGLSMYKVYLTIGTNFEVDGTLINKIRRLSRTEKVFLSRFVDNILAYHVIETIDGKRPMPDDK